MRARISGFKEGGYGCNKTSKTSQQPVSSKEVQKKPDISEEALNRIFWDLEDSPLVVAGEPGYGVSAPLLRDYGSSGGKLPRLKIRRARGLAEFLENDPESASRISWLYRNSQNIN